jgi:hypothetical protein
MAGWLRCGKPTAASRKASINPQKDTFLGGGDPGECGTKGCLTSGLFAGGFGDGHFDLDQPAGIG